MATRYYVHATVTPAVSPGFHAEWDASGSAVRRALTRVKAGSAITNVAATDATATADRDVLLVQAVTEPLAAQTIGGTVNGMFRVLEGANTQNLRTQVIVKLVDSAGTAKSVLYAGDTTTGTANPSNEWPITTAASVHVPRNGPIALTSQSAASGDRLVIEVGYRKHVNASTTGTIRIGDSGATDLGTTDGETTDNVPWLEFSQDLALDTTVIDTFTDTDGVFLENHAPSGGGAWEKHVWDTAKGVIVGATGRARGQTNSVGSAYTHTWAPATAEYAVEATFTVLSLVNSQSDMLFARWDTAANTGYAIRMNYGAGTATLQLWQDGTATALVTASGLTFLVGTSYVLRMTITNGAKYMTLDGAQIGTVSGNNAVTAAGRAGIRFFPLGAPATTGAHWDDFTIIGAGSIPVVTHPLTGAVAATSTVTATAITESHPLTGAITATATVAGTGVAASHPLSGTVNGSATVTGAGVTVGHPLAGSVAAVATVAGARLVLNHVLTGAVAATATVAGPRIVESHPLAGAVAAGGTIAGSFEPVYVPGSFGYGAFGSGAFGGAAGHPLAGAIAATAAVAAARIIESHPLAGAVAAASTVAGPGIALAQPLSGSVAAGSTATGTAIVVGHILTGTVAASATVQATTITVGRELTGAVQAVAAVIGTGIVVGHPLTGAVVATSAVAAPRIRIDQPLAGAIAGASVITASGIRLAHPLGGSVIALAVLAGDIPPSVPVPWPGTPVAMAALDESPVAALVRLPGPAAGMVALDESPVAGMVRLGGESL